MRQIGGTWMGSVVAVSLLAGLLTAVYQVIWTPIAAHGTRLNQSIEAQQRLLRQYESEIHARPQLLEQLEALQAEERKRGYRIEETSANLAAVALRTLLDRSAGATADGCAVQSQQERPGVGEASRVRVRARLRCSVEGLRLLLHDLEGGRPLVLVESLHVRPRAFGGGRKRTAAALDTTVELSARFAGVMQ